jgi:uncharacterized protein
VDAKAFLGRGFGFPVACRPDDGDVQLAQHEEDIRQAVRIILETNRGERLMRPDFGAGLNAFVFEPLNTATISLVRHRVEEALITWEPRIRIEGIEVQRVTGQASRLDVRIDYRVRATNTFYNIVYPFYLQEGGT